MAPWPALVAVLWLATSLSGAAVKLPCANSTANAGCIECLTDGALVLSRCYYCNYLTVPQWNLAGVLNRCKGPSITCATAGPKDTNCARCDGTRCVRCKPGYGINAAGKCASLATLAVCKNESQNVECAACNPDGTCNRCNNAAKLLLPVNAIFLDAGYPQTQCNTSAAASLEAMNITGAKAYTPSYCSELDTDFQCAACKPGYGPLPLTTGSPKIKCAPLKSGKFPSGCLTTLPYMNYCTQCSTDGKRCLANKCTGSRSVDTAGLCSLNCKGFFGIACKTCSKDFCLTLDPSWVYRRRM